MTDCGSNRSNGLPTQATRRALWSASIVVTSAALLSCSMSKTWKLDTLIGDDKAQEPAAREAAAARQDPAAASQGKPGIEYPYEDSDLVEIEPRPGAAVVGPMRPRWCENLSDDPRRSYRGGSRIRQSMEEYQRYGYFHPDRLARGAAYEMCGSPDDPNVHKQAGYLVQAFVNELGVSPDAAIESIAARVDHDRWNTMQRQFCHALLDAPDNQSSIAAAYHRRIISRFYGCVDKRGIFWDDPEEPIEVMWYLDRPTVSSELVRTFFVLACVPPLDVDHGRDEYLARYARCRIDALALDPRKLEREVAKASTFERVVARESIWWAMKKAAKAEAALQKKIRERPEYKEALVTAAERGWQAWQDLVAANRQVFDTVRGYEAKLLSRTGSMAGCRDTLFPLLWERVKAKSPRSLKEFHGTASDPVISAILELAIPCEFAEGSRTYADLLKHWYHNHGSWLRGPRFAAIHEMYRAIPEIQNKHKLFSMDPALLVRDATEDLISSVTPTLDVSRHDGVVQKLRKVDQGVEVSFEQKYWKEEIQKCVETDKVDGYRFSKGWVEPVYRERCKPVGTETHSEGPIPVIVPADMARNLRPGNYIVFYDPEERSLEDTQKLAKPEGNPEESQVSFKRRANRSGHILFVYEPKQGDKPRALLRAYGIDL